MKTSIVFVIIFSIEYFISHHTNNLLKRLFSSEHVNKVCDLPFKLYNKTYSLCYAHVILNSNISDLTWKKTISSVI